VLFIARAKYLPKTFTGLPTPSNYTNKNKNKQTNNCTLVKERQSPLPRLWSEAHSMTTTTTTRHEEAPSRRRKTKRKATKRALTTLSVHVCVCLLCEKRVSLCMYNTPKRQCEKRHRGKSEL